MTWVHILLAAWLTLAVPAAGVAAASVSPDCRDHVAAHAGDAHGEHQSHGAAAEPCADGHETCECDCEPLQCGAVVTVAAFPFHPAHGMPRVRTARPRPAGELPAPLPDSLFRPPISA